jgi:hypothetical protein
MWSGRLGVRQTRWAIVRHPSTTWKVETMYEAMIVCVIMHIIIVVDVCDNPINPGGFG